MGQLQCFSSKSDRTSNDAEWFVSPCPFLHEASGSLSLNRLPFLDKARWKCSPSLAWVCPCQNPAFLETSCLCSNTVCFGRPAPYMTNEDSKPTSSADFQSKAYVKENSDSATLWFSARACICILLLYIFIAVNMRFDIQLRLASSYKKQLINCLPIVCNKGCTA